MEKNPFSPDFGDGAKFSETEIARFQRELVIPSLNDFLWRGNFLSEAIPGCVVKKMAPLEVGNSSNWAEIVMEYIDECEAIFITLTIYQNDDTYTEDLIKGYKAEYIEAQKRVSNGKSSKLKRIRAPRLKIEEHSAWKLSTFNFSPNDLDGFSVNRNFELRDESNCVVWSTDTFLWDQAGNYADIDVNSDVDDLNELFDTSITQEDLFLIMDAFKAMRILPD